MDPPARSRSKLRLDSPGGESGSPKAGSPPISASPTGAAQVKQGGVLKKQGSGKGLRRAGSKTLFDGDGEEDRPGTPGSGRPGTSGSGAKQNSRPQTSMTGDSGQEDARVAAGALKRIDVARKSGKLDLGGLGLSSVPSSATELGEVARIVWLNDNHLAELPRAVGQWVMVSQVKLGNNRLTTFPEEIGEMAALQMLVAHDNYIERIPEGILGCKVLSMLDIRNNRMHRLPVFLGQLPALNDLQSDNNPLEFPHKKVLSMGKVNVLKYLKRFVDARRTRKLDLTRCGQTEIPEEIAYVGERLVELDVSDLHRAAGINMPFEVGQCVNLEVAKFHPSLDILSPPKAISKGGIKAIVAYLKRFNEAKFHGRLDLSKMELSDFPPELYDTKQMEPKLLRYLNMSDNLITALATVLGMMGNLEELEAAGNQIRQLPPSLGKLQKLRKLDVSRNLVSDLSHQICSMTDLGEIRLRGNAIINVSDTISDMPSLRIMDLGDNKIERVPLVVIESWSNLTSLRLDSNRLTSVAKTVGRCTSMTILDLSNNMIKALPVEIAGMASLETLDLCNNELKNLPDAIGKLSSLRTLKLTGNKPLQVLPNALAEISRFRCPLVLGEPHLTTLELDIENYNSPPVEVVSVGIDAIYDYLNLMRLCGITRTFVYRARSLIEPPIPLFQLPTLTLLDLSNNLLKTLPPALTNLMDLTTLILDGNRLTTVPQPVLSLTNLRLLSLTDNPLVRLPVGLGDLDTIDTLDIGMPELKVPPPEISRRGGSSVMTYFRRISAVKASSRLELARLGLFNMQPEAADAIRDASAIRVSLAHNRIAELSQDIGRCPSLRSLMLHANQLTGLPKVISKLTNLCILDLEGNRIEEMPEVLSTLTSLTELKMSRNDITECPLLLCSLTLLSDLAMDHNRISALPNRIGRCGKLISLSFACNELNKLPASMRELTCLTSLNVANNMLRIIPPEAGLLPHLEYADFTGNQLESPPKEIVEMGTAAIHSFLEKVKIMMESGHVDLSNSNLADIPLDILSYDAIHTIIVSANALRVLPAAIGRLRHLKSLDISFNQLEELPSEIGSCLNLEELYISKNNITLIPHSVGKLTKLTVLDLDHEIIQSPPEVVTRVSGRQVVRYMQGMLSGVSNSSADFNGFALPEIPQEIMKMVSVKVLRLSDNVLSSPFPPGIARFTRLERLSLDRNPRIRDLPKTVRLMTSLSELTLSGNEYTSIPEEVYRLTNLTHLDVSFNQLDGLGAVVGNLSRLITLDVRNNLLWTLPWGAMVKMYQLRSLFLQHNPVSYLSNAIGQLTNLTILNLAESNLPMLPVDIQDLTALTELNLDNVAIECPSVTVCSKGLDSIRNFLQQIRRARATTVLELIDCDCDGGREVGIEHYDLGTVLQSLDISQSHLDLVPQSLLVLSSLTFLNISQNQLKKLPEAIGTSYPFLEVFDASENLMTSLPRNFGGMTSLLDLLLSKNMLETLPPSISQCTRLTHLDLTDNQVSYLPKEASTLTRLSRLDMQFRFLTDLQTLTVNWNMWGKPPPDVVLQGGKVIPRFYKELITAAGMLEGKFNTGPKSTLNLSNFGLLHMPEQIYEKGFFTHLSSLNLETNKLTSIGGEVSRLTSLQTIRLKGNPIKRLTPSLGALPAVNLSCELDGIENVPDVWLNKGESGVVTYLQKAYTEISVGCMDFSSCGIHGLPVDISDFESIQELFLVNNDIDRLPAALGGLTNLTNLQCQENRIAALPREVQYLTQLKRLNLEGNNIRILPTELGLLTNLKELGHSPATFSSLPREIIDAGFEHILAFLRRLEASRGEQRWVQPLPGLKHGDAFNFEYEGQTFAVTVPYGIDLTLREKFIRYVPNVSNADRSSFVAEGYDCLNKNNVGHALDLSNMKLEKWWLFTASGFALDAAQDNLLEACKSHAVNPKRQGAEEGGKGLKAQPLMVGTMMNLLPEGVVDDSKGEYDDPRDAVQYELDNDGYVRASAAAKTGEASGKGLALLGGALRAGFGGMKGLAGTMLGNQGNDEEEEEDEDGNIIPKAADEFTREKETVAVERPLMTCDRPDPFLSIMVDTTIRECLPLSLCVASNLTTLNLDNNVLKTVASGVGMLSNLTCLSVRNNQLESISWRLRYLAYLRELLVSNNSLTKLPSKIGRCFRLQVLDVSDNNIAWLPPTIGRLEFLKLLDCSRNPISCLPHEIGGVDDEEHAKDIVGLKSIRSIVLVECEHLRQLPSKIYRLTTLTELDLEGSPNIVTPPYEVRSRGIPAMRDYLHWLYDGEVGEALSMSNLGLNSAPRALCDITRHVSEPQPRHEVGMPTLKHLDLSHNKIVRLPIFLDRLSNLRSLKVDHNRIEELPSFVRGYTRLGFLSCSNNRMQFFCPEVANMLSLRTLFASRNQIVTLNDGFAKLSTLRSLELAENQLRSIPEVLMKLSELRTLKINGNLIKKVQKSIVGLVGLHHLSVAANQLTDLPNELGELAGLQSLDAADNKVEMLPIGLGKLTNLESLDIQRNGCLRPPKGTQQKGSVAVVEYLQRVAHAEKRKLLDLSNFGLSTFPVDAVALANLTELNISNNAVTSVPGEIVALTRVVVLRMAENGIKKLSAVVGRLTTLETLDLKDNSLDTLPTTFHHLANLLHLDVSSNQFCIFPAELEKLTQIEHLNFTENQLSRVPTWMGAYAKMNAVLLGGNGLSTVPNSIGGMGPLVLSTVNLSNNGLLKVPSALCGVLTLKRCTFSGNALNELPAQIGRLINLEELWVDSNQLARLPPSVNGWKSLTALYLHSNKLQALPRAIVELERLTVLTLSSNEISDLPWNLPTLTNLEELWLDANRLSLLPQGLEEMPNVKDFTCKNNEFEGKELVRANLLMERFENTKVMKILEAKRKEEERAAIQAKMPEHTAIERADDRDPRELELEQLRDELAEAMGNDDLEAAQEIQEKLDAYEAEDKAEDELDEDGAGPGGEEKEAEEGGFGVCLTVTVIGCDELVPHKGGLADVYVSLEAGETTHKTKVQKKTIAPIFGETFEFKGTARSALGLSVKVMHKNMISADVLLGTCEVASDKYAFGRELIESINLLKDGGLDDAGTIDLKFRLDRAKA